MQTSQAPMPSNRNAKLTLLFFVAMLLFNFPIIGIFGKNQLVFGLPVLYLYIFSVWLLLIALVYLLFRKPRK